MKYTFEIHLPSQSIDSKHETTVDVTAKEDMVVGKINGVESGELVEPKEDTERGEEKKKKDRRKKPTTQTLYIR